MTIEQRYIDLINADIDGEISSAEKLDLDALLAQNAEAQALHAELAAFCDSIDKVESESPPPHLRHVIMNSVKPARRKPEARGFLQVLLATPALKYSATFAAGVILTLSAVSSDQFSNRAFDDVTGLVGTIAEPVKDGRLSKVAVDNAQVVGNVSLRSTGSILVLDFDLIANGPIEIEADYSDRKIWFNGFGQLENSGTTVSTRAGSVSLGMDGKRRYAVYLHNGGEDRAITVKLRFVAGGETVHEASLRYEPAK